MRQQRSKIVDVATRQKSEPVGIGLREVVVRLLGGRYEVFTLTHRSGRPIPGVGFGTFFSILIENVVTL